MSIIHKIKSWLPYKYLTEDEIVQAVYKSLTDLDKQHLTDTSYDRLIGFHSTAGRMIRNEYRLWDEKNPYTTANSSNDVNHPDQFSFRVIQKVWLRLKEDQ